MLRILVVCLILRELGVIGQSPRCDLDNYSSPYVRVQKKRNGPPIAEKTSREFLDLSEFIHKTLCVNGPAIIYRNYNFGFGGGKTQYSNGTIKMFIHECFVINQIATSKAMELRAKGIKKIYLKDLDDKDIIGVKAAGIFLLAKADNYYQPVATFLTNDFYEFTAGVDTGVTAASFVTVGKGPFCLRVDNKFDVVVANIPSGNNICRWYPTENLAHLDDVHRKRFEKIFNGDRLLSSFAWTQCGDESGLGPFPVIGPEPGEADVDTDPFAIIDPSLFINKLKFDAFEKQALRRTEDNPDEDLPGRYNNIGPNTDDDYDENNPVDLDLPVLPDKCIPMGETPTSPPDGCGSTDDATACFLMERALDIPPEPANVSDPRSFTVPPTFGETLTWKRDILYIISEIFGMLCEPFPPEMAYTVGRILEFYVARAHEADEAIPTMPKDVWRYLTPELSRCMVEVKKSKYHFLWYWDNRAEDALNNTGPGGEGGQFLSLAGASPVCKAVECSLDCFPEDDKCVLSSDVDQYCFSLGRENCEQNASLCYVNKNTGMCELMIECSVDKCQADKGRTCVLEGDRCVESDGGGMGLGRQFPLQSESSGNGGNAQQAQSASSTPAPPIIPTFGKIPVQEIFEPVKNRSYNFEGYPENVLAITDMVINLRKKRSSAGDNNRRKRRKRSPRKKEDNVLKDNVPTTVIGECLFYYEDMAETEYELNVAIDIFWKIFATVIGYCNKHYSIRKSETFPRLYNMFYEDFIEMIVSEWTYPNDNEALKKLLSEYNSDIGQRWLDVCLETSYIVSNSSTYRPPRPLVLAKGKIPQSNYFMQLPDYLKGGGGRFDLPDLSVSCPE